MSTRHTPQPRLDHEAIRNHFRTALRYRTPAAVWTAIADIPVLLAELDRVLVLLTRTRMEFATLLAAARATIGAEDDGESDPVFFLRDEVAAHGSATSEHRSSR